MLSIASFEGSPFPSFVLLAISFLLLASYYIRVYVRLRHVPGPLLASLSNLARRSWVLTGNSHNIHLDLHKKYGKVVRFGPNAVSISDTRGVAEVYGLGARFPKVSSPPKDGRTIQQ